MSNLMKTFTAPDGTEYEVCDEVARNQTSEQPKGDDHAKYFGITGNGVVYLLPEYRGAAYDATYPFAKSDNDVKVAGSKNAELPKHLVVPENVNGAAVEALADGIFQDNCAIEEITIPAQITKLPAAMCDNALNVRAIYGVENVTEIGLVAFQSTKLRKAEFPKLTSLFVASNGKSSVFGNCFDLAYADLGSVTTIPYRTFRNCYHLAYVKAPNVTSIGNEAFIFTLRLKNLDFLPNVTSIGNYAFMCSGVQYDWASLTSCTFGTNATSKQINPTDFWSACTVTAKEDPANPLPTFLWQSDPRWANQKIGASINAPSAVIYKSGCVVMSIMHVYCALHNLTLNSVEEFEAIAGEEFMSKITAGGNGIAYASVTPMCETVGMTVEDEFIGLNQDDMQKLLTAVSEGKYAIITVPTSTTNWSGHSVVVYGVRGNKELLIADSANGSAGNGSMKYPVEIQNLVKANATRIWIVTGLAK